MLDPYLLLQGEVVSVLSYSSRDQGSNTGLPFTLDKNKNGVRFVNVPICGTNDNS